MATLAQPKHLQKQTQNLKSVLPPYHTLTNIWGKQLHEEVLATRVREGAHLFNHLEDEEMLDKLTTPRKRACQREPRRGPSTPTCPLEQAVEPSGLDPYPSMIFPDVFEPAPRGQRSVSFGDFDPLPRPSLR